MSFRTIFRELRRTFTYWHEVDNVPPWVHNAKRKWIKTVHHCPYDMTKHFKGKTFIYKIYFKTIAQGQYKEIYHRKKRIN